MAKKRDIQLTEVQDEKFEAEKKKRGITNNNELMRRIVDFYFDHQANQQ